jgi:ubiquinone/menaquinone biosynthesis C-methylase UbiE
VSFSYRPFDNYFGFLVMIEKFKKEHESAISVWDGYHDEEWRKDQSHWRGMGRWKDDLRWQKIGLTSKSNLLLLYRMINRDFEKQAPYVFLEWGPGGGANIFGLKNYAKEYIGVDVSKKNLDESMRMIRNEGFCSIFLPVLLSGDPSESLLDRSENVDIFLSSAVFQHFPSKEYGSAVLKVVARVLKPTGVGVVQIRFDNGNPKYEPIKDLTEYYKNHITANSYRVEEFWQLLIECGLLPIAVTGFNNKNNYVRFFFRKKIKE